MDCKDTTLILTQCFDQVRLWIILNLSVSPFLVIMITGFIMVQLECFYHKILIFVYRRAYTIFLKKYKIINSQKIILNYLSSNYAKCVRN